MQENVTHAQEGKGFWKQYWFVIAAVLLAAAIMGVFAVSYYKSKSDLPVMKQMEDFTLENTDGSPFHLQDTDGKVRLVSFIFTNCPDICPATSHIMAQAQEQLKAKQLFGKDVVFLTITFDPERDTGEVLKKYAERIGADTSGWYFLRGDQASVEKVAKSYGIGFMKQENGMYIHTMKTFLLDKQKNLRTMYGMGADMNMTEMVNDMEELAGE